MKIMTRSPFLLSNLQNCEHNSSEDTWNGGLIVQLVEVGGTTRLEINLTLHLYQGA